jgi:flagellar motor switch protein FliN/FliY
MSANGAAKPTNSGTGGLAAESAVQGNTLPLGGGVGAALMVAETDEAEDKGSSASRLNRLPMQLDVMVQVRSMRVRDLLSLEKGTVLETVHDHTQDVPVECGDALLMWAEFEVLDQRLAVRITRLG